MPERKKKWVIYIKSINSPFLQMSLHFCFLTGGLGMTVTALIFTQQVVTQLSLVYGN